MADSKDQVSVERTIAAPASAIFALLADPTRHQDIDGSGSVRTSKERSQQMALGTRFGMSMRMGVPYAMENTVIEFEADRRIAWKTTGPGRVGRHVGGRIWRYELEPVDGGTLVRETWDISQESPFTRPVARQSANKTRKNMAATLERIDQLLTS